MTRTVGIGIQKFDEIIEKGYFYVDKTSFIKEWWENGDKVTLITRPRRFGKTLTISMTEQFFSINYAEKSNLFHGLDIWKNDDFQKLQGSYPVISISFAGIKETSYENAREKICQIITDLYADHTFLLDCGVLADGDKNFFRRVTYDMKDAVASLSLCQLSKYLSRYYGKKTMILLDEYDTPMQEAYTNGYWEELVLFTRNLFHNTFKTNPYLERGLLTGITRVSKESVFSDLNNLEVVTTTSEKYAEAFGFTEKEVFDALEEYGMGNQKNAVSQWYDGFTFGSHGNIYNPWSIINFLDKKKFAPYWINTSSNKLISKLLQEGSADVKLDMEELIDGKDFVVCIDEEVVYNQLGHNENAIWSLLLASGYLKVKNLRMNSRFKMEYCLTLTNLETHLMFEQMVTDWFSSCSAHYNCFIKALLSNDIKAMNAYMNKIALATFSSFDSGLKPSEATEPERFYHGFVLGLLVDLADRYAVTSNRESGLGRYDLLLEPLDKNKDEGIILEFKVHDPEDGDGLQNTAYAALRQIVEKKYTSVLESKAILKERIRIYGFAFEGKKVLINGGYTEDILLNSPKQIKRT